MYAQYCILCETNACRKCIPDDGNNDDDDDNDDNSISNDVRSMCLVGCLFRSVSLSDPGFEYVQWCRRMVHTTHTDTNSKHIHTKFVHGMLYSRNAAANELINRAAAFCYSGTILRGVISVWRAALFHLNMCKTLAHSRRLIILLCRDVLSWRHGCVLCCLAVAKR